MTIASVPMHLFFDLDGTLTDSREGITRCIHQALIELGTIPPPIEALAAYIGPPLPASFATLLGTSDVERVEEALAAYRRRFENVGIFENAVYPGIPDVLDVCRASGYAICVVTAKPRVYARRILEHFGIAAHVRALYGPELGERSYTKESLIRDACVAEQAVPERTIMVGDRAEDVLGAKANGLLAVAVAWGYGSGEELGAARPDAIVSSTAELIEYLRRAREPRQVRS